MIVAEEITKFSQVEGIEPLKFDVSDNVIFRLSFLFCLTSL